MWNFYVSHYLHEYSHSVGVVWLQDEAHPIPEGEGDDAKDDEPEQALPGAIDEASLDAHLPSTLQLVVVPAEYTIHRYDPQFRLVGKVESVYRHSI